MVPTDLTQDIPQNLSHEAIQKRLEEKIAFLANVEAEIRAMEFTVANVKAEIDWLTNLSLLKNSLGKATCLPSPTSTVQRNPMDMLRPEFKGKTLRDAVKQILDKHKTPLTTSELCRIIYDANSKDEFERARNSLSTELRSGAKGNNPKWQKIGRSAYVAFS